MNTRQKNYSFFDLVEIMEQLRGPDGCPWDREQGHESILKCLIEESYEFLSAVYEKNIENMMEELGDVLLQVVFHSQIAKENRSFYLDDVIDGLCRKLIRRHPHVFGTEKAKSASEVIKIWNGVKSREKTDLVNSLFSGIARDLPPLIKSEKIQKKVKTVGFEWPDYKGPLNKIKEEVSELEAEINPPGKISPKQGNIEDEIGDILFSVVNLARHLKVDPSGALEKTNIKFIRRFSCLENLIKEDGKDIKELSLEEMDLYWTKAKKKTGKIPDFQV